MLSLIFNTRDEQTKVELTKVVYFEADGNYTRVTFLNGYKIAVSAGLSKIEHLLEEQLKEQAQQFIRIGRQYIVNRAFIFQINVLKQKLLLSNMESLPVFSLSVSKEALKNLKALQIKK
ncbi:LytTR family DNA-binding domain-containing protein [Parabacteroides pacaensis]|uniref:LytTR family DNA-binding domain-containing protein n=1 Tax=Parabacteroides pacaensis TaxID=2086575 RepID=UPI000D0F9D9A|nr:LytTR family DNA-binding domain-containing protein [Parabacteroides pacaensis]